MNQHAASGQPPEQSMVKFVSRRNLLSGILLGGGAVGVSLGYKYRFRLKAELYALGKLNRQGLAEFLAESDRIHERHRAQTAEMVTALKAKYEHPVFGRMRVWDLVEKTHQIIDTSDPTLLGMSQFGHMQQVLAAMERHGISDPNLFLVAILHDVGKVMLLAGELPENVLCPIQPFGEYDEGVGLDNVAYQFGHGEFIYSRVKDYVPEAVAWTIRYHAMDLEDAAPLMNGRERGYLEEYLQPFSKFDGGFKSPSYRPNLDIAKYRDLIEESFPDPILF